VIELKRGGKEKRARRVVTRPEPTIYGNCDSWDFIVGKKPSPYSPKNHRDLQLQRRNRKTINSLLTIRMHKFWTTCGWSVDHVKETS